MFKGFKGFNDTLNPLNNLNLKHFFFYYFSRQELKETSRMETITYLKATATDIEMMSAMRLSFLTEYFGKQNEEKEIALMENLRTYFKNAFENNSSICWFAKAGKTIAGIGFIEIHDQPGNFKNPTGKIGHVMNMYTLNTYRKKGICTTILNRLVASANELGVIAFELHASAEGLPIYAKNGFHIHTEPTMRKYLVTNN